MWNAPLSFRDPRGLDGTTGVIDAPIEVAVGAGAAGAATGTAASAGATAGTSAPTLSLIAGGSAAGGATSTAMVTGGLLGVIIVTAAYDGYQLNKLGQAAGWWGPSSSSSQQQREYERYKDFCNSPVPDTGNRCSDLSKQIDHALKCIELREAWNRRWPVAGSHAQQEINNWRKRVQDLKNEYNRKCTGKGTC